MTDLLAQGIKRSTLAIGSLTSLNACGAVTGGVVTGFPSISLCSRLRICILVGTPESSAISTAANIYRAIFGSETKHIYFGVYKPDERKVKALDGLLAKYQKTTGSSAECTFFDSESAKVWDV